MLKKLQKLPPVQGLFLVSRIVVESIVNKYITKTQTTSQTLPSSQHFDFLNWQILPPFLVCPLRNHVTLLSSHK